MKILTVLGTRPEIIRLSLVIEKLDQLCDHFLVHTGQNYERSLNQVFFEELGVRQPDTFLDARGSLAEQLSTIFIGVEKLIHKEKPDRFLVLGDTNSALSAIIASRFQLPVYHMEAGNRCYDDRVPEEINRRIIDACSDVLMPYTERSRHNLLREGIPAERIFVTGNPILEVIRHHENRIQASDIHKRLQIDIGKYFLVTMHRAENVDIPGRLRSLSEALNQLQSVYNLPVIVSTHPRTQDHMQASEIEIQNKNLHFLPPFGFFDFIHLERNAFCVLSDSGTVQEECAIFHIPNVTLRDVTERPETLECGSNILSGCEPEAVLHCVRTVLSNPPAWTPPAEYMVEDVSDTVIKILLSYRHSCS